MTIKTYDKNGELNNVSWRNVKKIKLLAITARSINDTLLNLHMTFENGEEVDYYLSEHERFAVIEEETVWHTESV